MRSILRTGLILGSVLALSACAGTPPPVAPQPVRSIDAARFFTGRWYEIARTPMDLTKGCVAGTTDYTRDANGTLRDFDACHMNTPAGKEESFQGPVSILNPGENNKVVVHYRVFHNIFTVNRTYWMLDHGPDYSWFIVTGPDFKNLSIFTRAPRPSKAEVDRLTARARALGYDTTKLEYPTEFPPGAG